MHKYPKAHQTTSMLCFVPSHILLFQEFESQVIFSNFCHILPCLLLRPQTAHGHAVMCQGFVCNNDLTTEKCFPSQRSSEKLVKTFHSAFAGNCNSLSLMASMLFAASNSLRRAFFSTLFG